MKGGVGEWEEWIDGEKEEQGSTYIGLSFCVTLSLVMR